MQRVVLNQTRFFDCAIAICGLLFSMPLLICTAIWIKIVSRGTIFFRQERIGYHGRPFKIFKFRTMKIGSANKGAGTVTLKNDQRLIKGARVLRKFKIDELPQLLNVLNGTMAIVGPRPTVPDDYEEMTPKQRGRCEVKPGVTGLAQIYGNTTLSWPQRIKYDLQYVRQKCFLLDLKIICVTFYLLLTNRADTHPAGDDEWFEKKPRIVCVGSNLESLEVITGLIQSEANIVGLVTLPSEEDHAHVSDYADLHSICEGNKIPCIDTKNINSSETISSIRLLKPDYIYTLGWSQIFQSDLLQIPSQYIVGSHPTLLPFGRGRAPIPWTILQEQRRSAVTLFRMEKTVDDGEILLQKKFEIPKEANASDVYSLVAACLREAYCEIYECHELEQPIKPIKRVPHSETYRGKRVKADGHIDFAMSANEIVKLVRAVSEPFPGAYLYYGGQRLEVWQASKDGVPPYIGTVGQVLLKDCQRLLVQAGDSPLWLSHLTCDGKPVLISEIRVGDKFGYVAEDKIFEMKQEIFEMKHEILRLKRDLLQQNKAEKYKEKAC